MSGMRIRVGIFGVLLAIGCGIGSAASRSDFVVALPNGYQIVRDKASRPTIVKKSGGTVVPGPVASYAVIRDVVVGVVQSEAEVAKAAAQALTRAAPAAQASTPAAPAAPNATPTAADGKPAIADAKPASTEAKSVTPNAKPSAPDSKGAGAGEPSLLFERPAPPAAGYFVLETRNGAVGKDLSLRDFNERLKTLNIPPSPELSPPVLPK